MSGYPCLSSRMQTLFLCSFRPFINLVLIGLLLQCCTCTIPVHSEMHVQVRRATSFHLYTYSMYVLHNATIHAVDPSKHTIDHRPVPVETIHQEIVRGWYGLVDTRFETPSIFVATNLIGPKFLDTHSYLL